MKLEYLAVYGHAAIGVPVGELQSTMAPTTDYCLSHLYGDLPGHSTHAVTCKRRLVHKYFVKSMLQIGYRT